MSACKSILIYKSIIKQVVQIKVQHKLCRHPQRTRQVKRWIGLHWKSTWRVQHGHKMFVKLFIVDKFGIARTKTIMCIIIKEQQKKMDYKDCQLQKWSNDGQKFWEELRPWNRKTIKNSSCLFPFEFVKNLNLISLLMLNQIKVNCILLWFLMCIIMYAYYIWNLFQLLDSTVNLFEFLLKVRSAKVATLIQLH